MASFVDSVTQNIFGDLSHQQMLDFEYSVMGLKEKSYAELTGRPAPSSQPQPPAQPAIATPRAALIRGSPAIMSTKRQTRGRWRRRNQYPDHTGPRH